MNTPLQLRRAGNKILAPDQVPVRPYELGQCNNMALAMGCVEPGVRYGVHTHRRIEQITFVVSGMVDVFSFDIDVAEIRKIRLGAGEAVVTMPGETLEFRCASANMAKVLFITSPPYPEDNSDAVVLRSHSEVMSD